MRNVLDALNVCTKKKLFNGKPPTQFISCKETHLIIHYYVLFFKTPTLIE